MAVSRVAFGTTISFATGFITKIRNVDWSGFQRDSVNITSNDSTDNRMDFIPNPMVDTGELKIEMLYDADSIPPIDSAPETITVTMPPATGETSGPEWEFTGFLTAFEPGLPYDDVATATATLKLTGLETLTAPA